MVRDADNHMHNAHESPPPGPPEVEEYANVRLIVGQDIEVMDAGHWRHCRMCSVLL